MQNNKEQKRNLVKPSEIKKRLKPKVTPIEVREKLEGLLKEDEINLINQTEWFIKWWYEKHSCRMDYYINLVRT